MPLVELGRFSEAFPLLRDSLAAYDGMGFGPEHPQLGNIPQLYGRALLGVGRAADSLSLFQRVIAHIEQRFGRHHYFIPENLLRISDAYTQMGRSCDERLPLLDRAVAIRELSIGVDKNSKRHADLIGQALQKSAECSEEAGRLAEAEWAKCVAAYTKVS